MTETAALERLTALEIETPSWGYGNSGHAVPRLPVARRRPKRLGADRRRCARPPPDRAAARRSRCTSRGTASRTGPALRELRAGQGLRIGRSTRISSATTPTGSGACATRTKRVRAQALEHCRECIEIAQQVGSTIISLWLADGTNYPGQDDLRGRHASRAGLEELDRSTPRRNARARRVQVFRAGLLQHRSPRLGHRRAALPPSRPAGTGTRRHRPPSAGDERRADRSRLLAEGLLGGFHFNNRKYADDDLIVGSIDPFELFRIMREIAAHGTENVAFMIDQSHNIEGKIDAMIQSVMNIQTAMPRRCSWTKAARRSAEQGGRARGTSHPTGSVRDRRPPVWSHACERRSASSLIRSRRFAAVGYAERLARERGTASVESAYERT